MKAKLVEYTAMSRLEPMEQLSPEGEKIVEELARKYSVSTGAVTTLLRAVIAGHGTMAQFSHPELGGSGQWSQGGMTMIGDMFNQQLKAKVDGLCSELSVLFNRELSGTHRGASSQSQGQGREASRDSSSLFVPAEGGSSRSWWGADLGVPGATGSQNHIRYAYFPAAHRLAVGIGDRVTVYDSEDHEIRGISQQQSADSSLSFVSQHGLVRVDGLRVVPPQGGAASAEQADRQQRNAEEARGPQPEHPAKVTPSAPRSGPSAPAQPDDVFSKLERLADLRARGIVSDEEFAAKKAELLGRL